MKQIFTLLAAVFAALTSFAQTTINQGFNTEGEVTTLRSSCWSLTGFTFTNQTPIADGGSLQSETGIVSRITTPYLKVPANFTISFYYRVLSTTSNGVQKMKVFVKDNIGESKIEDFNMSSNGGVVLQTFNYTGFAQSGTKKIVIEVPASALVQIDGLQINAPYYYATGCNTAPVANPDTYTLGNKTQQATGNVLSNDTDENFTLLGEKATSVRLVTAPAVGTLVLNANGSFTYDPPAAGVAGDVVFEYAARDNGFDPAESNITTVTLEYPENAILPVKLVSFAGKAANDKAQLNWMVADNENAKYFEVEQSTNGYTFTSMALVFADNASGAASYQFAAPFTAQKQYYRLKIWDNEGAYEYSNVILLQSATAPAAQALKVWQAASNKINLQYSIATAQKLQLTVINLAGVVMHQQSISSLSGTNAQRIELAQSLKPGVYLVQLRNEATTLAAKLLVP